VAGQSATTSTRFNGVIAPIIHEGAHPRRGSDLVSEFIPADDAGSDAVIVGVDYFPVRQRSGRLNYHGTAIREDLGNSIGYFIGVIAHSDNGVSPGTSRVRHH